MFNLISLRIKIKVLLTTLLLFVFLFRCNKGKELESTFSQNLRETHQCLETKLEQILNKELDPNKENYFEEKKRQNEIETATELLASYKSLLSTYEETSSKKELKIIQDKIKVKIIEINKIFEKNKFEVNDCNINELI